MSEGSSASVGPVSVRYAAQIRELLHAHAVQRMVADQEAARANADAERAARADAAARTADAKSLGAKGEAPEPTPVPAPVKLPDAPAENPPAAGHLVDIHA
jgi:hypothetical protein